MSGTYKRLFETMNHKIWDSIHNEGSEKCGVECVCLKGYCDWSRSPAHYPINRVSLDNLLHSSWYSLKGTYSSRRTSADGAEAAYLFVGWLVVQQRPQWCRGIRKRGVLCTQMVPSNSRMALNKTCHTPGHCMKASLFLPPFTGIFFSTQRLNSNVRSTQGVHFLL